MQDAIFINQSAAETVRDQVKSTAIRHCIAGRVNVHPHYEQHCLKGYKVRWTDSKTGNGFNVTEEMMGKQPVTIH